MMNRTTWLILVLACLAAAGGWWLQYHDANALPAQPAAPAGVKTFAVGDAVSGYSLPDLDGTTTTLARWHGKALVLNFWATWCAPCRQEMPMLARFQREHATSGVQIVGIAMNQPQSARNFLRLVPVSYPILIGIDAQPDPTTVFGDTAGLLPYSVLVSREGKVLATKLGALDPATLTQWLAEATPRQP